MITNYLIYHVENASHMFVTVFINFFYLVLFLTYILLLFLTYIDVDENIQRLPLHAVPNLT